MKGQGADQAAFDQAEEIRTAEQQGLLYSPNLRDTYHFYAPGGGNSIEIVIRTPTRRRPPDMPVGLLRAVGPTCELIFRM